MDFLVSIAAYLVSITIGYGILSFLIGGKGNRLFLLFLAPGVGLAYTTVVLFISLYWFGELSRSFAMFVHLSTLVVIGAFFWKKKRPDVQRPFNIAVVGFSAVLLLGAIFILFNVAKSPYGTGLDAWAIWKLKAAFIYRGGQSWQHIFSPVLDFSHPDYPLFYPLCVVWGWLAAGRETLAAPICIAFVFTLSIIGLLMSALRTRGLRLACLAGLFMISTPHLIGVGSSQYADIIVSYFNLASVVLFHRALYENEGRFALVSGMCLGANAFVKNEGMLFLLVFFLCLGGIGSCVGGSFRKKCFRNLGACLVGALPMLLIVFLFKAQSPLFSDLVTWERLGEWFRYGFFLERAPAIMHAWIREIFQENAWTYTWIFYGLTLFLYRKRFFKSQEVWILLTWLGLNLGYFSIFLMTPLDVRYHLETSLDRLLVHGFPFLGYLCIYVINGREMPWKKHSFEPAEGSRDML